MPDGYSAPAPSALDEVLAGLSQTQKTLPAKLFYDAEGCRLFGAITRLPEYYLTRTEHAVLQLVARSLPVMPGCALVEYGASDEAKALPLLDALGASHYVPIDIAAPALRDLAGRMQATRPAVTVHTVAADFLQPLRLPMTLGDVECFGFFPGSTIGNLDRATAHRFLVQVRETLGADSRFLVSADLRKPREVLLPAYDDAQGVTAAFNKNVLAHLNHRFGSDFDLDRFAHRAIWNEGESRIEMHLESLASQTVVVGGTVIPFAKGETIHTENSYKHTIDGFADMAAAAGWDTTRVWTDPRGFFSIHLLTAVSAVRYGSSLHPTPDQA